MESPAICETFLRSFDEAGRASSRCTNKLSGLAYGYDVSMQPWGRMRVTASTQAGCERSRTNALAKDNMKVLSKCEKSAASGRK